MSKITFRADEDLVRQLEEFDASKSEVMREALRAYLGDAERDGSASDGASVDRLDRLVDRRVESRLRAVRPPDVNVNVSLDGVDADSSSAEVDREPAPDERKTPTRDVRAERNRACNQCGEEMEADHVYCPNCGEKSTHRVFCECGDEVRSDWAFCPGCGRRTAAADVLDRP